MSLAMNVEAVVPGKRSFNQHDRMRRLVTIDGLRDELELARASARPIIDALIDAMALLQDLRRSERQVLGLMLDGLPLRAIGERLGITYKTAKDHSLSVLDKFGVSTRFELVAIILGRRAMSAQDRFARRVRLRHAKDPIGAKAMEERDRKALQMSEKGATNAAIGRALGIAGTRVARLIKRAKYEREHAPERR